MLCLPGLTPVANDAHAVGDSGECVVRERSNAAGGCEPSRCSAAGPPSSSARPAPDPCRRSRGSQLGTDDVAGRPGAAGRDRRGLPSARARAHAQSCGSSVSRLYGPRERKCHSEYRYPVPRVRFLGIDYGQRRIGLALSDATGMLARPWKTITREAAATKSRRPSPPEVEALAGEDDGLAGVVLGYPRTLAGEATEQTAAVARDSQTRCARGSACRSSFRTSG